MNSKEQLPAWEEGMFDLHHISTGSGNAAFYIFPDGTTFLVDAGEIGEGARAEYVEKSMRVGPRRPSNDWTAGASIANYIGQVAPKTWDKHLDYALVTHYHIDHYGDVDTSSTTQPAKSGAYLLSGLTEVDQHFPIKKLFDRGFPNFDFPLPLKDHYVDDKTFQNYLRFIEAKGSSGKLEMEQLKVGAADQIRQLKNPQCSYIDSFTVRCLKMNNYAWSGSGEEINHLFDPQTFLSLWGGNRFNENPLSIALQFTYGPFSYFTGGDMTGLQGYGLPDWYDTESPTTKAIGQVDVTTMNHHGNRDGTNVDFVKNLQPQVVVQQAWCSDHPGMESFYRIVSKNLFDSGQIPDLFSIYMHDNVKLTYGFRFVQKYKSFYGHVLVRVMPGGKEFFVYVLNDTEPEVTVKDRYGPYRSNKAEKS